MNLWLTVAECCSAHPQNGTKKGRCSGLSQDADVMRKHVGGPLSAGSESLLPKVN